MEPSGRTQLVLGVVATAAVVVVSYFIVKRRAIRGKQPIHDTLSTEQTDDDEASAASEKHVSETSQELQNEETYLEQEKQFTEYAETTSGGDEKRKDNLGDEGQNQTSFIVIDNGEGDVPPDNDQNPKKSDRSSDDSSYDVIEDDDQLVETVEEGEGIESSERDEGGHALDVGSEHKHLEQDTFLDSNETSMVIIEDLDQSGLTKSESSFYASADENTGSELKDSEERERRSELLDVTEENTSAEDIDDNKAVPQTDDITPSHEDYKEERQTGEFPDQLDESDESASIENPVSEESLSEKSVVQDKEIVTSRVDIVLKVEPDTTQKAATSSHVELGASDITEVLTVCQNSPSTVSKENIHMLVDLLQKKIPELHSTVLNCVLRIAAFTQNVKTLRESGCLQVVADQLEEVCKSITEGEKETELLNPLCQVLTNLTLDPKCQAELQGTIPSLIDLFLSSNLEPVKLSVLRPLINFSSQTNYHNNYTRAVQELYNLLDTGSHTAKVQSAKVLVNLSLNETMIPHLLAAKAPVCLFDLLDLKTSTDLILRTLTMLANIKMITHKGNVSLASLPLEDKAASPETMYMALHSVERITVLRSKVFRLTRHNDEDVSSQASKLYRYIQETRE